ncbi:uncharacterized protein si:dkey-191g9.7 [Trichomycterus rosablanca]|uniref:uncharacterized protein si:dkey-191g9.7 n=1 Tax=Trichomycterus rosablanca TaxID=2290929 RepID=UPI002F356DBF
MTNIIIPCSQSTDELVKDHATSKELCNSSTEKSSSAYTLENASHVKEKASMDITISGVECQAVGNTPHPPSAAEVHTFDKSGARVGDYLNSKNNQQSLATTENSATHIELMEHNLPRVSIHTDNLQIQQKDLTTSSNCKTNDKNQDVPIQSTVHEQTMQPQSSSATSFCTARSMGNQIQQNCVQICTFVPAHVSGHCKVVEAPCYSPCHHAVVKDTFAAFCHPQPIPAPAQLIPRLPSTEGDYKGQRVGPACLTLPPLISSVSETRLDAKRLTHCCGLDCNWPGPLCQTRNQLQAAKQESKITKDAGTMTSCRELRDMGVQVSQTDSESSSQHVFPEVCLVDETDTGSTKSSTHKNTKVKEVKWDAEGMTWEVYGASVDPEELGLAIQKHLELQIKETADKAVKISQQNTVTKQPGKDKSQRKKSRVFAALRHPSVCCTRSSAVAD